MKTKKRSTKAKRRSERNERLFQLAKMQFGCQGQTVFRADAVVVAYANGAYVQSWTWVDDPDFPNDENIG